MEDGKKEGGRERGREKEAIAKKVGVTSPSFEVFPADFQTETTVTF